MKHSLKTSTVNSQLILSAIKIIMLTKQEVEKSIYVSYDTGYTI